MFLDCAIEVRLSTRSGIFAQLAKPMGDGKDAGASTGFSPHHKQQRRERSNRVTTRGRVPVLSPEPPAAAMRYDVDDDVAAECQQLSKKEKEQRQSEQAGYDKSVKFLQEKVELLNRLNKLEGNLVIQIHRNEDPSLLAVPRGIHLVSRRHVCLLPHAGM